jgi:tetratricopeptide (TPR) repeat protein
MQGLFAEAITALTDAIQLIPPGSDSNYSGEAYRTRGICWFYQDQNSLARGDFREAAGKSLEDPLPYLWMGFTYAKEEDYRKAIESYGEAIAKKPDFPLAHVNKGLAYAKLQDYQKAVSNFNEAIRAEPTEPRHFYKRGQAYEQLGEWQKALDSYSLALLRDGQLTEARDGAARALRALGRPSLAEQYENPIGELP